MRSRILNDRDKVGFCVSNGGAEANAINQACSHLTNLSKWPSLAYSSGRAQVQSRACAIRARVCLVSLSDNAALKVKKESRAATIPLPIGRNLQC